MPVPPGPDRSDRRDPSPATDVAPAPAVRRRRWFSSIFVRLAIIGLLGNLPILFIGYQFVSSGLDDIAFAEREQAGIAYIHEVWPAYQAVLAGRAPNGLQVDAVNAAGAQYDAVLGTAFYRMRFLDTAVEDRVRAVVAGQDFIAGIADNAGLSVDPDLNTLRAVEIVAVNVPMIAASALWLFADLGNVVDDIGRRLALDRFLAANDVLSQSLAATDALNFNTDLTARLGAVQASLNAAAGRFIAIATAITIGGSPVVFSELFDAHADLQVALSDFWLVAVDALDVLLANRVVYLRGQLYGEIEIAVGVYLVVGFLILWLARSISVRAQSLRRAVNRLRAGEIDEPVAYAKRNDEIGDVSHAVEVLRRRLLEKRGADALLEQRNIALHEHQAELATQNVRFDAALNNMSHGLAMFDKDRRLVVWNRRLGEIYRLPLSDLYVGASYAEIAALTIDRGRIADGTDGNRIGGGRHVGDNNFILECDDGRVVFVSQAEMPDGGLVVTHEDITVRRRAESQIAYMAYHDALTLLPNRALFRDRLVEALADRRPQEVLAVVYLDLDQFKAINDTLGHAVGDAVLKIAAERLMAIVPGTGLVSRLSGDEYAVLLTGLGDPAGAVETAAAIIKTLSQPYEIVQHRVVIGCSAGISFAPGDSEDADVLLKNADVALYRAKDDGRGRYRLFEQEMDAALQTRRVLEMDLRQALAHEELELYFQPQVDLEADRVSGFEALLRWHHPSRGLVQPNEFVPLAEETGLIVPLGEWVLRRACAEASTWPDDVNVAVNLSPTQFKNRHLVGSVVSALSSSQIRSSRLELEITESTLLKDSEATLKTLHQLRSLGVRISMDDFGTGYSSLSYLRSFPFDKIKIDRSFVSDLDETEESLAIIHAVVGLGRGLGMRINAEGVETPRQLQRLRDAGCSEVQGMLFSAPRPGRDVPEMLGRPRGHRTIAVA